MKALTVQQPWAWAIIHGGKDVENRTWATTHRGDFAVHAGARISERGVELPLVRYAWSIADLLEENLASYYTLGAAIGVANLVDVHTAEEGCCESPWGEQAYVEHGGRTRRDIYHWVLENPRPLAEPLLCRGSLGLWNTPPGPIYDRLDARTT